MKTALMITLLFTSVAMASEDPKHPEAVSAKKEYETQLKWAKATHANAQKKAQTQYVLRLKRALQFSLKASNLEDANRIKAVLNSLAKPDVHAELEKAIIKTRWKWNHTTTPVTLVFNSEGVVEAGGKKGKWRVISEHVILIEFTGVYALTFEDDLKQFKTHGSTGSGSDQQLGVRLK